MIDFPSIFNVWLLLKIVGGLIGLTIAYKISSLIISVYQRKRRFLKQGILLVPWIGFNFYKEQQSLLEKYGDAMQPIKDAAKKHPDAKAFLVQRGPLVLLTLSGPEHIKEYNNRIITDYDRLQLQKFADPLLKNGITTLTGEEWKLHRKILSESFHFDVLERSIKDNHITAVEFFENLSKQEMEEFLPRDQMKKVFSAITGQTFFGENVDKRMIEGKSSLTYLIEIFETVIQGTKNPLFFVPMPDVIKRTLVRPYGKFVANSIKFKKLMLQIIQETRRRIESGSHQKGSNIIEGLLEAQKQYKDRTNTLDDESICGEFITLLFAGTDITSVLLAMTLYYLALYPDLVTELVEEIHRVIPDGKVTSISQLNSLELMHSVLKEVLRLHPGGGFTVKEAIRDHKLLDIEIKKGDYVGVAIQANNVNPKYWEDPEKFNPRRFMKGVISPHMEPFSFLTFSTGMRNCIGQHFAMIQAKLVLLTFLTTFDFKLVPSNYKMQLGFKVMYEPMEPVKLHLTRKVQTAKA